MHPVLSGCVSKNDEIFALASFLLVLKSPVVQLSKILQRLSFEFLARRVLRDLVIIAHLCPLVKGFSKSFLKNFFSSLPLSQRCFESIPHPLSFVKRFSKSFSLFSRFLSVVPLPSFGQPRYYTTPLPFCQHFFVEFLRFGDSVKAHKCLS